MKAYVYGLAIETSYHGPTDTKGSRIIAHCPQARQRTTLVRSYDDSLSPVANHADAALALAAANGWCSDEADDSYVVGGALAPGRWAWTLALPEAWMGYPVASLVEG